MNQISFVISGNLVPEKLDAKTEAHTETASVAEHPKQQESRINRIKGLKD